MIYDLIIIGAGSAGLSAGLYAGRAKLKTLIIDKKEPGGQILNTSEVVNYPGIAKTTGPQLIECMKKQALSFGCEIKYDEIIDVKGNGLVKEVISKNNHYQALSLIIATGALPRKLHFKGEEEFTGRGIAYCATCDGEFFSGLDIFVVGGGYAACEEAMYLTRFGRHVTMIVREEDFTCAKTIADKVKQHPKIDIHFNSEVLEVKGDHLARTLIYINHLTKETTTYQAKNDETFGLFIFAGYLPATALFKDDIQLDEQGYMITNDALETSVEGIYAAGDLRPKTLRQIVTAVSDGAIAATNVEHYIAKKKDEYPEFQSISTKEQNSKQDTTEDTPFFQGEIENQLKEVFSKFEQEIHLQLYLNKTSTARQLEKMMNSLTDLTSKIIIEKITANELEVPIVKFKDYPIRFHGIPTGHEFNPFILTMYYISTQKSAFDEKQIQQVKQITKPVKIEIGITLSCHFCPDVVSMIEQMVLKNKQIELDIYDINLLKEFKEKYRIMSVPAILFNEKTLLFGSQNFENVISKIKEVVIQ